MTPTHSHRACNSPSRHARAADAARRRTLAAAAGLGIDVTSAARAHGALLRSLAPLAASIVIAPSGSCVLVSGPSGAGKSTLLHLAANGARRRGVRTVFVAPLSDRQRGRTVAAQRAAMPLGAWVRLLAAMGLAEARVLITPAGQLSQGQSARLRLAIAAARCARLSRTGPVLLVADDWCAALDAPTARSLCAGVRRWLAGTHSISLLCAATDDTLSLWLRPHLHLRSAQWGTAPERSDQTCPTPAPAPIGTDSQGGDTWTASASNPAA